MNEIHILEKQLDTPIAELEMDYDDSEEEGPRPELLVKRKAATYAKIDLNPSHYPYDYIKKKTQVRTLLNTLNRQRWQRMIESDLIEPGLVALEDREQHASTDLRYDSNYRESKQTVDVDRQSLGTANVNNYVRETSRSFRSKKNRSERFQEKRAEFADKKILKLNERINKYAQQKQEMLEQAVTMAQMSNKTPHSFTSNTSNYAHALLPGFKSMKMTPLPHGRTTMQNIERSARNTTMQINIFADGMAAEVDQDRSAFSNRERKGGFPSRNKRHEIMNMTTPQVRAASFLEAGAAEDRGQMRLK